jgi:hypothetical protein
MAITQLALGFPAGTNLFQETVIGATVDTVKNSGGTLFFIQIDNTANAAISYLKLFNTNAAVTLGTTVPDDVILVPASIKLPLYYVGGKGFLSGLQAACVTTGGTGGVTPPGSSVVLIIIYS